MKSIVEFMVTCFNPLKTPRPSLHMSADRSTIRRWFLLATAVLIRVSDVNGDIITFDNLANSVAVTNQYAGVVFSSSAGFENRTFGDADSFGSSAPNHLLTASIGGGYTGANDTYVDFSVPVSNLTFLGTAINTSGQVATINVFVNSTFVSSVSVFGDGSPFAPDLVDLSTFSNVTRIEIHSVSDPGGLGWDDFQFTPIPEPNSLLLSSAGTTMLCRRSRRRRSYGD